MLFPRDFWHFQKSSRIVKSPPHSASRDATLRWPWKKHEKVVKCVHFRAGLYAIRTRLCSPNTLFRFPGSAGKVMQKASQNRVSGHSKSHKIETNGHSKKTMKNQVLFWLLILNRFLGVSGLILEVWKPLGVGTTELTMPGNINLKPLPTETHRAWVSKPSVWKLHYESTY